MTLGCIGDTWLSHWRTPVRLPRLLLRAPGSPDLSSGEE